MKCNLAIDNKICNKNAEYRIKLYSYEYKKNILFLCQQCYLQRILIDDIHGFSNHIVESIPIGELYKSK